MSRFIWRYSVLGVTLMITGQLWAQVNDKNAAMELSTPSYGIEFRIGRSISQPVNDLFVISEYTGYQLEESRHHNAYDLSFAARINSRWAFFGGLSYVDRSFYGYYYCHVCDIYPYSFVGPSKIEFRSLEIPIKARYRMLDHKIGLFAEAGINPSFLVNKVSTRADGELNVNRFSLNGFIGFGSDYNLNSRINLNMAAGYRRSLYAKTQINFQAIEFKAGMVYYFSRIIK